MTSNNDDLPRLMHETLEQLGWPGDPAAIAARVRQLDQGLPAEDEFTVLCAWLGRCGLIHKFDQAQMPATSRAVYQVPDLLSTFTVDNRAVPVLIEIKTTRKNALSFRPDYLQRLRTYAALLGLPLLIAWKWRGMWCLFETGHFVRANKNFNISWGRP